MHPERILACTLPEDIAHRMPLELVAGKNPYTTERGELPVTLLWHGTPISGIQIRVFRDNSVVSDSTTRKPTPREGERFPSAAVS